MFRRAAAERLGAVVVVTNPYMFTHRAELVQTALQHRMPAMYWGLSFVEAGGLMAYGTSGAEIARRAASYVDRIFKGAKPGDLAVEMPSEYELVVNLKTAKALGLTIPQSVLLRASRVIE